MEASDEDEVVKMKFFIMVFLSKCEQIRWTVLHVFETFKSQGCVQVDKEMCSVCNRTEITI